VFDAVVIFDLHSAGARKGREQQRQSIIVRWQQCDVQHIVKEIKFSIPMHMHVAHA
jgi:hypothetical protein